MHRELEWRLSQANHYHLLGAAVTIGASVWILAKADIFSDFALVAVMSLTQCTQLQKTRSIDHWRKRQELIANWMWVSLASFVCAMVFWKTKEHTGGILVLMLGMATHLSGIAGLSFATSYVTCILQRYERLL